MSANCNICNRVIESHLREQNKEFCFTCLVERVSDSGALASFKIKEKPIQAPCAVCERDVSGRDLGPSPWGFICSACRACCETQTGFHMEDLSLSAAREWLIRSVRKIMGPFSTDEVHQLLMDQRVVSLDEICKPFSRWQLIRDNEVFRFTLNEIKNKKDAMAESREQTASGTATDVVTESLTLNPFQRTERLLEGAIPSRAEPDAFEPAGQQSSRDIFRSEPSTSKSRKSKGTRQAPRTLLWTVSLTSVALLAFLMIRLSGGSGGAGAKGQNFQEAMARGLSAEKIGDYTHALEAFNEAQNLKSRDPEVLLHLAPLVLTLENRSLEAERIWNQILELEASANYKKSATMGLGLVALVNQQYDQAFNKFAEVLKSDPQFATALGNLGIVQFYKGHLVEAEELLVRTLNQGADGAFALAIADVAHALSEEKNDKAKLRSANEMLKIYIESMHDYRQEALLVSARTLLQLGKESEAQSRMEEFYDTDPEQTDSHLRDWMVYRSRVTWDSLVDVYRKVSLQLGPSPRSSAGLGIALFKTQEKNKGADLIKQALQQAPNDPIVLALDGWVQLQLGNRERATTSVNEAVKRATKQKLPFLMAARLCEESKDWDCAKKHWESLSKIASDSVQALVGLARVNYETKRSDQASVYVKQALATDPTYTPALALAQKIQSSREAAQ